MGETYHYLAAGACCLTVRILAGYASRRTCIQMRHKREKHVQIYKTYDVPNENSYVGIEGSGGAKSDPHPAALSSCMFSYALLLQSIESQGKV